jgi:dTDP-4-dehydrorhamnose 3,5-epimerase
MKFTETALRGLYVIDIDPHQDDRGFFARTWCSQEFEQQALESVLAQCSVSFNKKRGTLRGMHYQAAPDEETKVIRCTMGSIFDVLVDLRPESTTFKKSFAIELSAKNRRTVYAPKGFAHGFLTLEDESEVFYQISHPYVPELARGFRWNDPAFGIQWPFDPLCISERDANYPDL